MAALRSRCGHYILPCLWFLSIFFSFFLSFFFSECRLGDEKQSVNKTRQEPQPVGRQWRTQDFIFLGV